MGLSEGQSSMQHLSNTRDAILVKKQVGSKRKLDNFWAMAPFLKLPISCRAPNGSVAGDKRDKCQFF
jgi:hypothetical protein